MVLKMNIPFQLEILIVNCSMCISKLHFILFYSIHIYSSWVMFAIITIFFISCYFYFVVHLTQYFFYMHFRWFEKFIMISFHFYSICILNFLSTFAWNNFPVEKQQHILVWRDFNKNISLRACMLWSVGNMQSK